MLVSSKIDQAGNMVGLQEEADGSVEPRGLGDRAGQREEPEHREVRKGLPSQGKEVHKGMSLRPSKSSGLRTAEITSRGRQANGLDRLQEPEQQSPPIS
jgi:hypothetical protein